LIFGFIFSRVLSSLLAETREFLSLKWEDSMSQVLVIASKVKQLIKEQSGGMNTSASVMEALTKVVEKEVAKAIEKAKADGRKTVMDRDFD
jgi:histone H3/H4